MNIDPRGKTNRWRGSVDERGTVRVTMERREAELGRAWVG